LGGILNNQTQIQFSGNNTADELMDYLALEEIISKMSPRKQIVVALMSAGYTQEECGTIIGLTRAAIGYTYNTILREMRTSLNAT
jgi:hypothetical protein